MTQERHPKGARGGQFAAVRRNEPSNQSTSLDAALDDAYTTTNPTAHARYLSHPDEAVRANAAASSLTTVVQANALRSDPGVQVRWELANHQNAEIAALFTSDEDPLIRFAAYSRLDIDPPREDAQVGLISAAVA